MKTIAIAGSKPGLILPVADAVYAANAAFLTDPDAFSKSKDLTVVASSLVMSKGLFGASANAEIYRKKYEAVREVDARRIVLLADPTEREHFQKTMQALQQARPQRAIEAISGKEKRNLIREVTGGGYPIVGVWCVKQPARVVVSDLRKIVRSVLSWSFGSGNYDVPGRYRPSTGVMALLIAIREHGLDQNYVVAGIGLKERDAYRFSDGTTVKMERRGRGLPAHVIADAEIIRLIAKRVKVSTTEPDLGDSLARFDGPIAN